MSVYEKGTKEVTTASILIVAANPDREGIHLATNDTDDVFLDFPATGVGLAVVQTGVILATDVPVKIMGPLARRAIYGITAANTSTVAFQEL